MGPYKDIWRSASYPCLKLLATAGLPKCLLEHGVHCRHYDCSGLSPDILSPLLAPPTLNFQFSQDSLLPSPLPTQPISVAFLPGAGDQQKSSLTILAMHTLNPVGLVS